MNTKTLSFVELMFLTILTLCSNSPAVAAKFYKWTDEDGGIHYADKPDAKNTAEIVDIYTPKPSSSPVQRTTTTSDKKQSPENPKQANSLEEYCKTLSANINTLETKTNISSVDADGKKTQLSEADKKDKLDSYKKEYQSKCGK